MMTTILSNLNQRLAQLEAGNLSAEEMELLVEDAKELYERLVILRYKIYETNVLGPRPAPEMETVVSLQEDPMMEEVEREAPSFDLFEVPVLSDELNPMPLEVTLDQEESTNEWMEDETNLFEQELIENEDVTQELALDEEVTEEDELGFENNMQESDDIESPLQENEVTMDEQEELISMSQEVEDIDAQNNPVELPKDETIHGAWILQIEQTIRSDRSVFPLETLIGSFSLNEKLQFINELFDGSSDAFSTATKKLDACSSMSDARVLLTEFSSNYDWDLESEIVEDFIFKICRRYA